MTKCAEMSKSPAMSLPEVNKRFAAVLVRDRALRFFFFFLRYIPVMDSRSVFSFFFFSVVVVVAVFILMMKQTNMGIDESDKETREQMLNSYTMEQKLVLIKALEEGA